MAITAPTDIAACVAWKEAKETSTITIDGSNNVTQFNDQVTTNHYTDIIGTPKSGTRTHNGHNVIDFNGASLVGEYGAAEQTQPVTVAWCGITDDLYAASSAVVLGSARINDLGIGISNGNLAIRIGATFYETSVAAVIGDFVVIAVIFNDTSTIVRIDNVDVTPAGIPTFTDRWRDGGIGAASTATASPITTAVSYYNGAFCEYAAWDAALTSANLTDVYNYFVSNWAGAGITITGVTGNRAGETARATVSGVDLTAATTITGTFGGTAVTGISVVDASNVDFTMPSDGFPINANQNLIITVDAVPSAARATAFLPPTGMQGFALTVDYASLDADSFLVEAGLSALVTGDEIILDLLDNQGGTLTFDPDTGLVSTTTSAAITKTFDYYIQDASDTYAAGATDTATILGTGTSGGASTALIHGVVGSPIGRIVKPIIH